MDTRAPYLSLPLYNSKWSNLVRQIIFEEGWTKWSLLTTRVAVYFVRGPKFIVLLKVPTKNKFGGSEYDSQFELYGNLPSAELVTEGIT